MSLWRLRKRDPRCPRPFKGFTAWRNLNYMPEVEAYEQILLAERATYPTGRPAAARAARKLRERPKEPGECRKADCYEPIVAYSGFGRPPTHCEKHQRPRNPAQREGRSRT